MEINTVDIFKKARPVFICGHYRSGTSLLNHLFDGHPEIIANGYETKFFTHFIPQCKSTGNTAAALENSLLRIWTPDNEYRKKYFPGINPDAFRDEFNRLLPGFQKGMAGYLECNTYVYALLTGQIKASTRYWAEKTPHNEFYIDEILEYWPQALFINMIRDPRDLHATLRKRSKFHFSVRTTIHNWERAYDKMTENAEKLGKEKYLTIRYEDLVSRPQEEMKRITDFLKIAEHPTLFTPSMAGGTVHWEGNAVTNKFSGISTKSIGQWEEFKNENDYRIIDLMLQTKMEKLGYHAAFKTARLSDHLTISYHRLAILYKEARQRLKGEINGAI